MCMFALRLCGRGQLILNCDIDLTNCVVTASQDEVIERIMVFLLKSSKMRVQLRCFVGEKMNCWLEVRLYFGRGGRGRLGGGPGQGGSCDGR